MLSCSHVRTKSRTKCMKKFSSAVTYKHSLRSKVKLASKMSYFLHRLYSYFFFQNRQEMTWKSLKSGEILSFLDKNTRENKVLKVAKVKPPLLQSLMREINNKRCNKRTWKNMLTQSLMRDIYVQKWAI